MACSIEHSATYFILIFIKLRHSLYLHCRLTLKALLMSCNLTVKRVVGGGGGVASSLAGIKICCHLCCSFSKQEIAKYHVCNVGRPTSQIS